MDPRWRTTIAIVVVAVVIIAGVTIYYVRSQVASSACSLASKNPLIYYQAEKPDSADPAVVFTTPGWGIAQQVYQTLVMYNHSGSTPDQMVGVLAKNWSHSADFFHWNFTLRSGEHFSNGDPINAYVMWYSLYRGLAMGQPLVFLQDENFYVPGLSYYSPLAQVRAENTTLANQLNTFNFFSPTASQIAVMSAQNQSFRVLSSNAIQFNLGFGYLGTIPYAFILDQIATPPYSAVDPAYVDANGGVQVGMFNGWMATHMLGSGPFLLTGTTDPTSGTGYTLTPDPNYWGTAAAAQEPWNNIIQPAKSTIAIDFQADPALDVLGLKSGSAAVASFAYIGPSTLQQLNGIKCLSVTPLPTVYGSVSASFWVYMNQHAAPFNNLSVRAAIVHAINYTQLIQVAYGGNAASWVGPVPPGYSYYNPGSLSPYQYNLRLAWQEMNNSPYPFNPSTGRGGYPTTMNFEYINVGTDLYETAQLIQGDLAAIGIRINLVGVNLGQLAEEQALGPSGCGSTTTINGGPFPIGEDYYTADYVAPDDATQLDALSYGSYNVCQSEYANTAVMDPLVIAAAGENNATRAAQDYATITSLMYQNYTDAWLFVPTAFSVHSTLIQGIVPNPMGSGLPFTMVMNTQYAS